MGRTGHQRPDRRRWRWIRANLVPWEASDSDVWGASLACVAASLYPDLAPRPNLQLLYGSLQQASRDPAVSLHAKSGVLWCDAESGRAVLEDDAAAKLSSELLALQREDGGWALRDLGPWTGWEGSDSDCCERRVVRSDAYATGFVTLALSRSGPWPNELKVPMDEAVAWIDRQLANPYPAGPTYNTLASSDTAMPEFRDNLYANAGAMWSYLAKRVHVSNLAPWEAP